MTVYILKKKKAEGLNFWVPERACVFFTIQKILYTQIWVRKLSVIKGYFWILLKGIFDQINIEVLTSNADQKFPLFNDFHIVQVSSSILQ